MNWAKRFSSFCFLDNHQYQTKPHTVECLLAAGVKRELRADSGTALNQLQQFMDSGADGPGWLFGHLGYDMKNEIERLSSSHPDCIGFPDLFFFEPEFLIRLNENEMTIEAKDAEKIYEDILRETQQAQVDHHPVNIQSRLSKE